MVNCAESGPTVRDFHYAHIRQGARFDCQSSSRTVLSRSVSIACQKPVCRYARSSPSRARPSKGSTSHELPSPSIRSRTDRLEYEEAAVDERVVARRLLDDPANLIIVELDGAISTGRYDGRQSRGPPVRPMERDKFRYVHIR